MAPATTSPTSAAFSNPRRAAARGFTLVEMLVVIGIILVILGLTAPMLMRAWRFGDRTRTSADLNAIAAALEAYRQDHGDYPRVAAKPWANAPAGDAGYNGARMLCRALIAPGPAIGTPEDKIPDGAGTKDSGGAETLPGAGFRTRPQGRVFGPYLRPQDFKLGDPKMPTAANPPSGKLALLDHYGKPILYYPALGRPNIYTANGFVKDYDPAQTSTGNRPLYNSRDNTDALTIQVFARLMGDANANGAIDKGTEQATYEGAFVLWSAGPDEAFGPQPAMTDFSPNAIRKAFEKSDDITNFRK